MLRQMRILNTKSNRLLRLFHWCSTDVKLALFVVTVLALIVHFYGLIISQHIVRLELILIMSKIASNE